MESDHHMYKQFFLAAGAALCFLFPAVSHAGQGCEHKPPSVAMVTQGIALAVKTVEQLNASGADVVIIGRVGQDLSKYQQHYSHLGFAYRDGDSWTIVHKLNECDTALSNIYEQGMGQFFLDDPFRFEAAIVVPTPQLQQQLRVVLSDARLILREHWPAYNMLSYPWSS